MKRRGRPKLLSDDIYKCIAQQSSLTQQQARECFLAYYNILVSLIDSEDRPENFVMMLPKMGNFAFKNIKGKKKGFKYSIPAEPYSKSERKIIVLDEDEPDYERITFELSNALQERVKRVSKNKTLKKESFSLNFLKDEENEKNG